MGRFREAGALEPGYAMRGIYDTLPRIPKTCANFIFALSRASRTAHRGCQRTPAMPPFLTASRT